ncbi:Coenzyme PQQ synthesis protein E [uncultured archaeon]|nr:Coenzyme PQQ synthesis protein E [uncultured archaeon]
MYEVKPEEKLTSLSILVGTGNCNANCGFCAGKPLRKYAPKADGQFDEALVRKTLADCFKRGASYLSLSSCGEPTLSPLSVTKVLGLVQECANEGMSYSPVNLYSNGIRIGEDKKFSEKYLPLWKNLGLTTMYITVHDIDEENNARVYGVKSYPSLEDVFSRVRDAELSIRTNLVLSRGAVDSYERFIEAIDYLQKIGADNISAWPLRDETDGIDLARSPDKSELVRIHDFVERDTSGRLRMIFEEKPTHYHSEKKLTLFPDGSLASSWCNR